MKRINKLLLTASTAVLALFTINCVHAEEISTSRFSDSTSIQDDLKNANLDIKDYIQMSDKQFNRFDVVLLTENVDSDNTLLNYVYVYNPFKAAGSYIVSNFNYTYNNEYFSLPGELVSKTDTISKYKIDTDIMYLDKISSERNYKFDSIVVDGAKTEVDFSAKISQSGQNIELEFDGYIFITDKDLLTLTPISNDVTSSTIITSNNTEEYYSYGLANTASPTKYYNRLAACLMFLNFDTNKEIDKINEIDLKYQVYRGRSEADYLGNEYHTTKTEKYTELWADYSTKYKTIKNDKTSVNYEFIDDGSIPFKYHNSMALSLKTSYVKKTDGTRTQKFSSLFENNDMTKQCDSGLTWQQSFDMRQCSMLIDVLPVFVDGYFVVMGDNFYYWNFLIKDLNVMRINFTTDGVTYNMKCNSGAPIDSDPGIIDPTDKQDLSLMEKFLKALKNLVFNHTGKFIMLLCLFVILIILIVKLGIKAIVNAIWYVIKFLFNILLLPFKLLKSLFTRG